MGECDGSEREAELPPHDQGPLQLHEAQGEQG